MAGVPTKLLVKRFGVKNICVLCGLLYSNNLQQKQIISRAEKELIKCICECSLNILNGNVKLSDKQKKQLRKHKKVLRNLSSRKGGVKQKKKIVQRGGAAFLPALLAPILGGLISKFILGSSD